MLRRKEIKETGREKMNRKKEGKKWGISAAKWIPSLPDEQDVINLILSFAAGLLNQALN